mmetsp:Transcript_31622/g.62559  ORF Transcript_31622/g.62559 Transcript_31622/m.62559 type:complete len:255 (-) Transcript_31622:1351-2115(-)
MSEREGGSSFCSSPRIEKRFRDTNEALLIYMQIHPHSGHFGLSSLLISRHYQRLFFSSNPSLLPSPSPTHRTSPYSSPTNEIRNRYLFRSSCFVPPPSYSLYYRKEKEENIGRNANRRESVEKEDRGLKEERKERRREGSGAEREEKKRRHSLPTQADSFPHSEPPSTTSSCFLSIESRLDHSHEALPASLNSLVPTHYSSLPSPSHNQAEAGHAASWLLPSIEGLCPRCCCAPRAGSLHAVGCVLPPTPGASA